mmetsp:Transcript_1080/g.1513  ORF Transcript_1080/g.1513 Transcript_1080/m.1513 type:complete len:223 (+) Transcript_1080:66-734(+)
MKFIKIVLWTQILLLFVEEFFQDFLIQGPTILFAQGKPLDRHYRNKKKVRGVAIPEISKKRKHVIKGVGKARKAMKRDSISLGTKQRYKSLRKHKMQKGIGNRKRSYVDISSDSVEIEDGEGEQTSFKLVNHKRNSSDSKDYFPRKRVRRDRSKLLKQSAKRWASMKMTFNPDDAQKQMKEISDTNVVSESDDRSIDAIARNWELPLDFQQEVAKAIQLKKS